MLSMADAQTNVAASCVESLGVGERLNDDVSQSGEATAINAVTDVSNTYPGLSGRALQDKIWADYAINQEALLRRPYFDDRGRKVFERHALNDRHQAAVVDAYKESIKKEGVLRGVRSDIWAVASSLDADFPERLHVISGASLIEAAYKANAEDQDNPNVIRTLAGQVFNITVFQHNTPAAVIHFLVDIGNVKVGTGSVTSHIQKYKAVDGYLASWAAYREKFKIKSRMKGTTSQSGYESSRREWLLARPSNLFPTLIGFDKASDFYKDLSTTTLWEEYRTFCESSCKYLEIKEDDHANIFALNHFALRQLGHCTPGRKAALLVVLKFIVPNTEVGRYRQTSIFGGT